MHPDHGHTAAFVDGRRLREAAYRRRERAHMRHTRRHDLRRAHLANGRYGHRVPHNRWLWLMAIPLIAPGASMLAFLIFAVLMAASAHTLFPLLVIGMIGVSTARRHRRRVMLRRGGAAGTAPLPGRPAAPPRPDLVWARARERFHTLRGEYAAFECNTMEVLRIPALTDVSVASTGRFVDAFAEAQALETDSLPPEPHRARFVAAVDLAERTWKAARDAAERIRLSGLSAAERGTVERVIKLLTTARDSDSDPERLAAYARARSELAKLDRAGVIHLPRTAMAALEADGRGALPA